MKVTKPEICAIYSIFLFLIGCNDMELRDNYLKSTKIPVKKEDVSVQTIVENEEYKLVKLTTPLFSPAIPLFYLVNSKGEYWQIHSAASPVDIKVLHSVFPNMGKTEFVQLFSKIYFSMNILNGGSVNYEKTSASSYLVTTNVGDSLRVIFETTSPNVEVVRKSELPID